MSAGRDELQQPGSAGSPKLVPMQTGGQALAPESYGGSTNLGYVRGGGDDDGGEFATMLVRFIAIVLKRKWLILGCALTLTSLGTIRTLMQTPIYLASVRIQIDREPIKVVEGGSTQPADVGTDFLRTQYEVLKSRAMAERVVSALQLHTNPDFLKPQDVSLFGLIRGVFAGPTTADTTTPPTILQAHATSIVTSNVSIRPVPASRIVDIVYANPSPAQATQIANAYAEAYIASNLDQRFEANSYAKTFLEDQLKQLKLRLEESENKALEFAEREKIIEVNEKSSISESNLSAANAALGQLISERVRNEQAWRQVSTATEINIPQLLTNSVIEGLRARRNALVTEYEEKRETFKPEYPAMVQITNKMKEIDRQLAAEVRTIRESFRAAYESSLKLEAEMKARIEELRDEVLDLQRRGIQYGLLRREVESNRGLYNSLLQRFKQVDIAGGAGANNVFIIERALPPSFPSEPNVPRAFLVFLALGLGLGLGASYVLEMLDDKINTPDDLEAVTSLPTLGIIPRVEEDGKFIAHLSDPFSGVAEAYRSLATALQFSTESGVPRSISVTSAGPAEGKSSTALAIARHFATRGLKVLLIDADLRKPSLHEKINQDGSIGLSNVLTGAATPPEVIQKTDNPNLAFMGSGPIPPNAADLLAGTRMYSLISVALEVFDIVVVDTPPMLGLADAQLVSSATAGTIFVVGASQQRKGAVRAGLRRLQLSRTQVVGAVLTKFDARRASYGYGYGYGYDGYGYGYGSSSGSSAVSKPERASNDSPPRASGSIAS